jgi:hypothetical protein
MRTKLSARLLGVFFILIILLTACGTNLQEEIIGRWGIREDTLEVLMMFSFEKDGVLNVLMEDIPVSGNYVWLDDTTIQMTLKLGEQSEEITGKVQIEGDQMTITNEKGEAEIFTRLGK